jgi:hypothetical protein
MVGNRCPIYAKDIPLIFNIFLSENSAGIRLMKNDKVIVENVEMTLCPIQLQTGVHGAKVRHGGILSHG